MTKHIGEDRPPVFRSGQVQAAARSALDGEPIDAIATRFGVSSDTVLRMLRFPTAPYLAAMNVVDNEDAFGTVYDLQRLRAYKEMLVALPKPASARYPQRRSPNMGRLEFRLAYLMLTFAGKTFSRSHIETLLAGMTEGANAEECSAVVDLYIARGKLHAADDHDTRLHFPP